MAPKTAPAAANPTAPDERRSRLPAVGILAAFLVAFVLLLSPAQLPLIGQASAAAAPAVPSLGGWTDVSNVYLPSDLRLGAPLASSANVAGSLTFAETDPAGAANVATAVNDPASPFFQHYLKGDQFDAAFGPDPSVQASLSAYLSHEGLQVSVVSPFLWNVRGTAQQVGAAFDTTFVAATTPGGPSGYAPLAPMRLPSAFSSTGVQATGAFQNAISVAHSDSLVGKLMRERSDAVYHPAASAPVAPHATLTLNVTNPFIVYPTANNFENQSYDYAPTGLNESYTLTITGGTAPYDVQWWWGDGTLQNVVSSTGTLVLSHNYPFPGQTDYCDANFTWSCTNMTVRASDGGGDSGIFQLGIVPAASPRTVQLFYNALPLYEMGDTGQGTQIGIDDMCDTTYPTADYMTDLNHFSATFGLPQVTATTLKLIGSGNTDHKCTVNGGGSQGWAGETLLDMEWSHTMAPNATLVVDLSASVLQEGDATWDTLSNGVYVDSNSWGCAYNSTAQGGCGPYFSEWNQAAAQGQSFLTASGDCGAVMFGYNPPADSPSGLGVGGTDIYPFPSGIFRTEFAWNGSVYDPTGCENDEGSTGGYASNYAQLNNSGIPAPWYQLATPGFGANIWRGVPDVAAIGGTWVEQYQAIFGGWFPDAGTSLASPSTAGMLDLIYEYNGTGTKPNGLANNDLYEIANGANYNLGFHDITVGNNVVWSTPLNYTSYNFGPCAACYNDTVGWDPVTGLGSFDVSNLAQLVAEQDGNPNWLAPLTAYLATNVSYGLFGLDVNFGVDVAGGPASLSGYSYLWEFGDGTAASTSVPWTSHSYSVCGTNDDAYVIVSAPGVALATSNVVPIHTTGGAACPLLQAAIATNVTSGAAPLSVSFVGSASGGAGGYTWSWSFGDGSAISTVQDPSHTYTKIGSFMANLTVTDSLGRTTTASVTLTTTGPLSATITATPTSGAADLTVAFTSTVTGGTPSYSYAWEFGDGGTSGSANPSHTYTTVGTYSASLVVMDSASHLATSNTLTISVSAPATLTVAISAASTSGAPPLTVAFTSAVTGGVGPYTYAWDLGGSATSTAADPSHTYDVDAVDAVSLVVTDSADHTATSNTLEIVISAPVSAKLTAGPTQVDVNTSVDYWANATSNGSPTFAYYWLWGSATPSQNTSSGGTNWTTHTFTQAGTYQVRVVVQNSAGFWATSAPWTVTVVKPTSSSPTSSGSTSPLGGLLLYALIAAVIVVVAVVAIVVMRRKKGPSPPTAGGDPSPPPMTPWPPPQGPPGEPPAS